MRIRARFALFCKPPKRLRPFSIHDHLHASEPGGRIVVPESHLLNFILAGAFIAIVVLSGLSMALRFALSDSSNEPTRTPVGDVGSIDYELTGEVVESGDERIVVTSAAVTDLFAYLVYTRTHDGDPAAIPLPLAISSAVSSTGEDFPATQLTLFERGGVEVGLLRFALAPGPADYRLGRPGLSSQGTVIFRARNGAGGGTNLMNATTIKGNIGYRTQLGERAVIGPDLFAAAIDVVDRTGARLGGAAVSIDGSGTVTAITDEELAALVDLARR